MPSLDIVRSVEIEQTPRVLQLEGVFDIPPSQRKTQSWHVDLPLEDQPWNIGLIVGPSGSGKTTILKEFFGQNMVQEFQWDPTKSILDAFPEAMGIKEISELLNSCGFSSPPSWVKPYHVLSNGEKFRINLARAFAESEELCVMDEFTSVVDRTVAKIGSHAAAKTVRKKGIKFIAGSCHYDIEEWLNPDWVFKPHENIFRWRRLRRRPDITLEIVRVHRKAWEIFKHHHYLTQEISNAAQCFVALWDGVPVAFNSFLHFQNNSVKSAKRGHRVVVLPDYQGCSIGVRLVDYVASCVRAMGHQYYATTAHPALIAYRNKSERWQMIRKPRISTNHGGKGRKNTVKNMGRMVATFRYVGPSAPLEEAERLLTT